MSNRTIDTVAKALGTAKTRRDALKGLGGAVVVALGLRATDAAAYCASCRCTFHRDANGRPYTCYYTQWTTTSGACRSASCGCYYESGYGVCNYSRCC